MALYHYRRKDRYDRLGGDGREEPHLAPEPGPDPESRAPVQSEVFDAGRKTIVDCAHVQVERLDTRPGPFSKVFKEFEDGKGQRYDYRYWAERENFFLREFLKKQSEFTHVVQARHLISENEAAKQVLTCDAGITIANWLRVKPRYADTATLSHPFQRSDAFLRLIRACLVALKQIHVHRIVHCDIKEDNICIPYAPNPFPGDGQRIHLEFEKLKLIDFAFSIAHAIPLTQILVIDPDERVPYQSELLVSALRSDRSSGSPNAVQQLDYRVDLFSLGYMAEKISAAGLDSPPGGDQRENGGTLEDIRGLVQRLKAFDSATSAGPLPHDGLIAEIDRLLVETAGPSASLEFTVSGEWTAEEMAQGRGGVRKTPLTPVALPLPTPVPLPHTPAVHRARASPGIRKPLLVSLVLAFAVGGAFLYQEAGETGPALPPAPLETEAASESIAAEYGEALASSGPRAGRSRALARLVWMARAGSTFAAERVAAFEKTYDEIKQTVARSAWWVRGQGPQPEAAARWVEDGVLLAENGDRPAMLDVAFALGHGRALRQDRVTAVESYLNVMARADGADQTSSRIRQSAARGLAAVLNAIVEQKDQEAAKRLFPALESRADSGAADAQYYLGLMNECVTQPANLEAARQWYLKAAADPAWKQTAGDKARLLGKWCPSRPI